MTKVRDCCTFLWAQDLRGPRRVVFARPYHCAACVGEMVRSAKLQRITISGSVPMERVRSVLARQRPELLDRWRRQLRAAAEAGFALDEATIEVLPALLDAADRALVRRFQPLEPQAPRVEGEARRAAMQSSLLGDFLFDAVLETCPEISAAEQRVLSDALSHASVDVLVRAALLRDDARRRRERKRLAKLVHDLRNAATAAQLALDLRNGRALQRSMAQLREKLDDAMFDEAGLRLRPVKLGPVLAGARSLASGHDVKLLLSAPQMAQVEADPKLFRPAVRGMFEAALALALPGSTIRVAALRDGDHARVSVSIEKLRSARLPSALPGLEFARRAARAHGGSLSTKMSRPRGGCELRFDLPCTQPH